MIILSDIISTLEPAARHAMQRGSYWTVECRQAMVFREYGTKRSNLFALCPAMGVPLLLLIHFVQSFCENPTSSPPPKGQRLANLMLQIQQKSNKNQPPMLTADQLPAWTDNIWKARGQSWIQVLEGMDLVPFRIPGITRNTHWICASRGNLGALEDLMVVAKAIV